jgi:hypothetical protein
METTIRESATETITPVLYYEDNDGLNNFKGGLNRTLEAMQDLWKDYKYNGLNDIPSDPDNWAARRMLEIDKDLKAMSEKVEIDLTKIKLAPWIANIKAKMKAVNSAKGSHLPYVSFIKSVETGFALDQEKVNAHCNSFKKYFTTKEQIERLNFALDYLKFVKEKIKPEGGACPKWRNPAVIWPTTNSNKNYIHNEISIIWVEQGGTYSPDMLDMHIAIR